MAPTFPHWHTCEECLHSWKHKPMDDASDEEIREYHMCPACHAGPWPDADRYSHEAKARARALARLSPQERLADKKYRDLLAIFESLQLGTGGFE
jgi:hypothetical protein